MDATRDLRLNVSLPINVATYRDTCRESTRSYLSSARAVATELHAA